MPEARWALVVSGPRDGLASLSPFRFDDWIQTLGVPAGSALALVAHRAPANPGALWALAVSGQVSSGTTRSTRFSMLLSTRVTRDAITSVPSSRGKPAPRLGLTAGLAGVAAGLTAVRFSAGFAVGGGALFLDGLVYNLPSLRLKDWPDLDGVVESRTRPIRLVIRLVRGVPVLGRRAAAPPPGGGSLAELRLLRPRAAVYRATFTASLVGRRLAVPLVVYGAVGRAAVALLFLGARPSSGRSRRSSGSWPGPYE